jgi:hypothetical protein
LPANTTELSMMRPPFCDCVWVVEAMEKTV